ncbi:DsrE/DsrF-like family protein [mine drainage metagenome]|jgi:intracellular sulfur oxidation DsrE/DsrF family protein|uniref:DsrE/DsrF-like family protein n=1 Tax=mine drainage metagenome TaxID=410659 RepID=A0A1J5QVL5_9ZZZZ
MTPSIRQIFVTAAAAAALAACANAHAADPSAIHVDIPVHLKHADVVFNMDHRAFAGDLPVGMHYMDLLSQRYKKQSIGGKIIGVFHGDAAYMVLNDHAYDLARHVTTGNPYARLIAHLRAQGVQIEECRVSMMAHHWGNADLLPGVLVNGGAVARLIWLHQQGYAQIQP